jgi:protein phosphatase
MERHFGKAVQCYKCGKTFMVQPPGSAEDRTEPSVEGPMLGPSKLDIGCATSVGRVRDRNEDSFLVKHQTWSIGGQMHEMALLIVADGMGGHAAGDRASGLTVRMLDAGLTLLMAGAASGHYKDPAAPQVSESMLASIGEANKAVYRQGQSDPSCRGMGATLDVVVIWNNVVRITHVGDCRVHHLQGGKLTQVTRDQTLVARMVELGQLSAREAANHPRRNEISQAVGKRESIEPASYQAILKRGDWLLVACDGLETHVSADILQKEIARWTATAADLAFHLVELANEGGGTDNCTVIVAHCT